MTNSLSVTKKFLRVSPLKIHRVAKQLKGKSYKTCLFQLENMPPKIARCIWKTLKEAGANASTTLSLPKENLIVAEIYTNRGPILKRTHARARGKAYRIEKIYSHLTIILKK